MSGLVEPNSGRCTLDGEDKYYNRAEEQDYPAIEQVLLQQLKNSSLVG